jgi:FAD synthetase
MQKVMCAGTFDIVHPGHLYYLSDAKKHGDELIVVVARDDTVIKLKGKPPVNRQAKRLEAVRNLKIVDKALLGKSGNIFNILEEIKPNVICLGYDQYVNKEDLERELKNRSIEATVIRMASYMPHKYKSSKMIK